MKVRCVKWATCFQFGCCHIDQHEELCSCDDKCAGGGTCVPVYTEEAYKKLEAELKTSAAELKTLAEENAKLKADNADLLECVKWYANEDVWSATGDTCCPAMLCGEDIRNISGIKDRFCGGKIAADLLKKL